MSSRATRGGIACLVVGTLAIAAAYAATMAVGAAPAWAPGALAVGASVDSVALFVLGAATRRTFTRGVGALLVALMAVLVAAFGAGLLLPAGAGGEPLLLGIPRRLAIVFYGIGFLPLFVLPLVYARTFDPADGVTTGAGGDR
jgi:hypothetical protein